MKYHWGADDTIMRIIKRKDNSPEFRDLWGTTHRIDITRKHAPPLQQKTGKTNPSTQKTG